MENLNEALLLLCVGMGTVFVILLVIIYFSKGLIALINKYLPEEKQLQTAEISTTAIPGKVIAAITAAVNIASNSKAAITKIEKNN